MCCSRLKFCLIKNNSKWCHYSLWNFVFEISYLSQRPCFASWICTDVAFENFALSVSTTNHQEPVLVSIVISSETYHWRSVGIHFSMTGPGQNYQQNSCRICEEIHGDLNKSNCDFSHTWMAWLAGSQPQGPISNTISIISIGFPWCFRTAKRIPHVYAVYSLGWQERIHEDAFGMIEIC